MSGIFGIVHFDGRPVESAGLERMRDAMAHRGPDGSDIWTGDSAGLGHLMLCSTPESLNERLPWHDPESGLVITADARIDNREELIKTLGISESWDPAVHSSSADRPGLEPKEENRQIQISNAGLPDSQLILAAYKHWGKSCVEHLLGDFAFAILDSRNMRLFCARDPMGLRPFYYFLSDKLFVFASSAQGIVASKLMAGLIREERIADYLAWEMEGVDKTCTFFQDVWRMPPAHMGSISGNQQVFRQYWCPDPETELALRSDEEYTDALEESLTQAVRVRLRCHLPTASMLSGGLDSSTVVGIARKLQLASGGRTFSTYSGVSEEGEDCRESRYVKRVIDSGSLDATLLRPSSMPDYTEAIDRLEGQLEDPFETGWTLHQMIYLSARKRGQCVVMDGLGGESTTALTKGYPMFLARQGHWLTTNRELIGMWKHFHRRTIPLWWKYRDLVRATMVPESLRRLKRRLVGTDRKWLDELYLMSPGYAEASGMRERLMAYRTRKSLASCQTIREAHARSIGMSYVVAGTERYGRMAAACGVENRSPLLDRRLVELCLSLPWDQLVRNGWSKYGLRRVAERVLPREVAWRTGWDEVMWKFWVRRGTLYRSKYVAALESEAARLNHMIDQKKFIERLNRYMIGNENLDEALINLAYIVHWLRRMQLTGHEINDSIQARQSGIQ